jgi:NlpC/P60 family putative phage cell wall peptidase
MSDAMKDRIVAIARNWIGTPFHHQASLKGVGCDCLGLLRGIWREVYEQEAPTAPPYVGDWARSAKRDILKEALNEYLHPLEQIEMQRGHVLLFRWRAHWAASHIGIVTTPESMIHAHDGAVVQEVDLPQSWRKRITACFKFP